jgi:cell division protein FtsL
MRLTERARELLGSLRRQAALAGSKPNRKRRQRAHAEPDASRPSQARAAVPPAGAFRRLGALLWPERFPELAAWRAERSERVRARAPRGFLWVWTLAVALATAAFVAHLNVRFQIIQTGYALSQAQGEQRRMRLAQRELRLELATLKEPGRIEEQARALMGMERPDHQRIIRLDGRRGPRLAARRQ